MMFTTLKNTLSKFLAGLRQQRRRLHLLEYNGQWTYAEWDAGQSLWQAADGQGATPEAALASARQNRLPLFDTRLELLQDLVDRHVSQIFQEEDATDASDLDEADCHELLRLEWIDIEP